MKFSALFKLGYMPRWLVICMDATLSFFAIILSYLLRFNFETEKIETNLFTRGIVITVCIYLVFFFIFQSFKEIIRHTTYIGIVKIFLAVLAANIFLIAINFLFSHEYRLIPYSVTGINFFISFFTLAGSRIAIKKLFETAMTMKKDVIVIFGAGTMGLAALKTITNDNLSDWRVMAFVDDDVSKQNKFIGGIKVYEIKAFAKNIKRWSVKRAVIAVNNISLARRNEVADFFIQHGVKVSILPYNQQWIKHNPFKIRRLRDIKIEDLLEREPIKINSDAISGTIKNKSVLITGAAGSIGSEIVKQVAAFQPKMLLLCDVAESPLHSIGLYVQENFPGINFKLLIRSITDLNSMEKVFSAYYPSIIFHAAAYKHVPMMEEHPPEAILNNIQGTRIIADLAVKYNAKRFVMISTDKAVNPTNVMGASKRIAEMYVQSLNNNSETLFITTRFGNVLDSNGSVLPTFKAQLEKGGPITVTHHDITRFFMTIPEACQLVLEAGTMGKGGEIFIFDMGKSVRIKDLAEKMIRLAGLKPNEDIQIQYTGLRPGEKLYEEVLNALETTTETYHPKIKIAKIRPVIYENIRSSLKDLIYCAKHANDWECVKQMKEIVPEFVSNNSKFEKLDREREFGDVLPLSANLKQDLFK